MKNIETVIKEYLSRPSDFAVQIVGGWGWGKTHYYKNYIEERISKTKTFNNDSKRYKPIYISLFGLKSTEEIATKIVIDFFQSSVFKQYAKNEDIKKTLSITESIFKIGARGFMNFFRIGNVNDYMTDIKKIGKNVLDTTELVICFDDIDRKDSQLKIEDLAGYINHLVDEGIKVILIANETVLTVAESNYIALKEKIIGITIPYLPDVDQVLDNIINTRYAGFPHYQKFLSTRKEQIQVVCRANDMNFRHINYALDRWHECYVSIKNGILDTKEEINSYLKTQLDFIFRFTIATAAEFKASRLHHKDANVYTNAMLSLSMIFDDGFSGGNAQEREAVKLFMEKYGFEQYDYKFYNTLFQYVTGADDFTIEAFRKEFIDVNNLDKGKTLPQYQMLNAMGYDNCYNLSDSQYKDSTQQLVNYASTGMFFKPVEYLYVMHFAERFENLAELDLDSVLYALKIGVTKAANRALEEQKGYNFEFMHMSGSSGQSDRVKELHKHGENAIEQVDNKVWKNKIANIFDVMFDNPFTKFEQKLSNDADLRAELENPIFTSLDLARYQAYIQASNGQTLKDFLNFLRARYNSNYMLKDEGEIFEQMLDIIDKYVEELKVQGNQKLRSHLLQDFLTWGRKTVTEYY